MGAIESKFYEVTDAREFAGFKVRGLDMGVFQVMALTDDEYIGRIVGPKSHEIARVRCPRTASADEIHEMLDHQARQVPGVIRGHAWPTEEAYYMADKAEQAALSFVRGLIKRGASTTEEAFLLLRFADRVCDADDAVREHEEREHAGEGDLEDEENPTRATFADLGAMMDFGVSGHGRKLGAFCPKCRGITRLLCPREERPPGGGLVTVGECSNCSETIYVSGAMPPDADKRDYFEHIFGTAEERANNNVSEERRPSQRTVALRKRYDLGDGGGFFGIAEENPYNDFLPEENRHEPPTPALVTCAVCPETFEAYLSGRTWKRYCSLPCKREGDKRNKQAKRRAAVGA